MRADRTLGIQEAHPIWQLTGRPLIMCLCVGPQDIEHSLLLRHKPTLVATLIRNRHGRQLEPWLQSFLDLAARGDPLGARRRFGKTMRALAVDEQRKELLLQLWRHIPPHPIGAQITWVGNGQWARPAATHGARRSGATPRRGHVKPRSWSKCGGRG